MAKVYKPVITVFSVTVVIFLSIFYLGQKQAQSFDMLAYDIDPDKLGFTANDKPWFNNLKMGNYYAVIVGVADYPGTFNDLDYTDDDAVEMQQALLQYLNWDAANIELLLDSNATVANIRDAIFAMGSQATEKDVCLFYFSGHGTNKTDKEPFDEVDGRDEYLCAYDGDICDDDLSVWLGQLPTSNVVVIIDTCFSGGVMDKSKSAQRGRIKSMPGTTGNVLRGDGFAADFRTRWNMKDMNRSINSGCVVLTASEENQLSMELSSLENGLFTYFVLQAIDNKYDLNYDGVLSAEEVGIGTLWSFWVMYSRSPSLYSFVGQMPQFMDDFPSSTPRMGELPLCY